MKVLIARLRHFLTGKHDPMDLLNGVYQRTLPNRLTISRGMLKSERLACQASDLVGKLCHRNSDSEFSLAQKLRRLPKHWGTLEAVMFYHTMVDNGGHEQYFENSEGAFCDLVEDGLRLFAGDYHRDIFQKALSRYRPVGTVHAGKRRRYTRGPEIAAGPLPDEASLQDAGLPMRPLGTACHARQLNHMSLTVNGLNTKSTVLFP